MELNKKDFKKLCDVVYRRTGIAIEEKKFDILGRKIEAMASKKGFDDFNQVLHFCVHKTGIDLGIES